MLQRQWNRRMGLLGRLLGGDEEVEPPADRKERRRLEHERRKLKRQVKDLEKTRDKMHCSTCAKSPVRQDAVAVSKALKDKRARLSHIEARLEAGEAS